jgi:hypothetical protein
MIWRWCREGERRWRAKVLGLWQDRADEAGEKAAAEFKREDICASSAGRPVSYSTGTDGPVDRITQNKDTIVLEYGQFGLKRTIYEWKEHRIT